MHIFFKYQASDAGAANSFAPAAPPLGFVQPVEGDTGEIFFMN